MCVCLCAECVTGANTMSEALAMSLPETALKLLDVQKQHDAEIDFCLMWDPLLSYVNTTSELLCINLMSAGLTVNTVS